MPERVIRQLLRARSTPRMTALMYASVLAIGGLLFLLNPWICACFLLVIAILLFMLTVEPQVALLFAVTIEILIAILVPTYAVPGNLRMASIVLGLVIAACALARTGADKRLRINAPLVLLFLYFSVIMLGYVVYGKFSALLANLPLVCWAFLLYVMLMKLGTHGLMVVSKLIAIIMAVAVVLAAGEMFAGMAPLWGFMGSDQDISMRDNNLIPSLPGRAVSFFGHPILFGLYCAITAFITVVKSTMFGTRWHWRLAILLLAAFGIFLSGSRSPLIGLVAALIVAYLSKTDRTNISRLAAYFVGIAALGSFAWFYVVPLVMSAAGSLSFEHRFGIVSSFAGIMDRELIENILGSGPGASQYLFSKGTFAQTGLTVIDNQFILSFVSGGFMALVTLMAFLYYAFTSGNHITRGIVVMTTIMMFSFDTSSWGLGLILMTLCAGFQNSDQRERYTVRACPGVTV